MIEVRPSERMTQLGVVRTGDTILTTVAKPFDLPAEAEVAANVVRSILEAMAQIAQAHDFSGKGVGLAAPQIGIPRAAAVVKLTDPGSEPIVLLTPRITHISEDVDEQYEGCLSFFDVRGLVPRPLETTVESTDLDGNPQTAVYRHGVARLIHHEIDHLDGLLYTNRMRPGVSPIPVDEYRQTGQAWIY